MIEARRRPNLRADLQNSNSFSFYLFQIEEARCSSGNPDRPQGRSFWAQIFGKEGVVQLSLTRVGFSRDESGGCKFIVLSICFAFLSLFS